LFKNFVHDADWQMLLEDFEKHFAKQIEVLEKLGERYHIIMPSKPPLNVKFATNINDVTDSYIYKKIYHDLIAQLLSLVHAVRSSSTNDKLRNIIIDDLTTHFEDFDDLYKFGKLKGWEETYPVYKTAIPHQKEQLSTSEAFHIWDHINLRYEQIELIGIFMNFAHDTEFKVILQHGIYVFSKQVSHFEKLALKFNVPLPNRPPSPILTPIDTETIRNDSLRKLWGEVFNTELEYYDKYLKYGKMKGWTRSVPMNGEPIT